MTIAPSLVSYPGHSHGPVRFLLWRSLAATSDPCLPESRSSQGTSGASSIRRCSPTASSSPGTMRGLLFPPPNRVRRSPSRKDRPRQTTRPPPATTKSHTRPGYPRQSAKSRPARRVLSLEVPMFRHRSSHGTRASHGRPRRRSARASPMRATNGQLREMPDEQMLTIPPRRGVWSWSRWLAPLARWEE